MGCFPLMGVFLSHTQCSWDKLWIDCESDHDKVVSEND